MTNLEKANAIWKEAFGVGDKFDDGCCPYPPEHMCVTCSLQHKNECEAKEWWNQKYDGRIELEPITDWSKVAVDTPILVKETSWMGEEKAHFAQFIDGKIYAFECGKTSFTTNKVREWEFARLAESEDING